MTLPRRDALALLRWLDLTAADEIHCDEFLQRVPGYLEQVPAPGEPAAGHEQVVHHLSVCPECREECEALHRALRGAP